MDSASATVVQSRIGTWQISWEFEDLYRSEFPGLVAVATVITGDRRDGEDLVQDTMVKTFMRWEHVGRLERPGAWCHRVLVNACRSKLRRRRRERRYLDRLRRDEQFALPDASADVIVFWQVVREMPTRPRTVVAMYFAGGHTTVEIAELLGCPEGTVRSDLSRARGVLADRLGF